MLRGGKGYIAGRAACAFVREASFTAKREACAEGEACYGFERERGTGQGD